MGITLAIAIGTGIIGGYIASRLPFPEHFFDDHDHFHEVEYGDDTAEFNAHQAHGEQKKAYYSKDSVK